MAQDDYSAGVGTYIVSYEAVPKVKLADIKKEVPKWKVDSVGLKITATPESNKVGDLTLANPKDEDILKGISPGKKVVLTGTLTEDDKGKQTLTLSKVAEAK